MASAEGQITYIVEVWVADSITSLICTIIQVWLLRKEFNLIRSGKANYTTPYLRLWVILCISCGILSTSSRTLRYLPIFCHFGYFMMFSVGSASQPIFMGFYQLSRLYYCFSQHNIYSERGYPQYLFYIMFLIGGILSINYILQGIVSGDISPKCGIDTTQNYTFYRQPGPDQIIMFMYWSLLSFIYFAWDLSTLFLYIYKIQSFKKVYSKKTDIAGIHKVHNTENTQKSEIIYNRINNIMNRVLIITIFYEITVLLIFVIWILPTVFGWNHPPIYVFFGYCLPAVIKDVIFSLSVTLMVEHNTERYIKFLRFINRFRLHYICCCCCYGIINQQIDGVGGYDQTESRKDSATTANAVTDDTGDLNVNFGLYLFHILVIYHLIQYLVICN